MRLIKESLKFLAAFNQRLVQRQSKIYHSKVAILSHLPSWFEVARDKIYVAFESTNSELTPLSLLLLPVIIKWRLTTISLFH